MGTQSEPGRAIGGRYRLVEPLGEGGMGLVWKAHDEELHVDVAVKEVRLPLAASDAERAERTARARREARSAAQLRDHPNIAGVHDVVIEDDVPWIVMQLVDGRSLAQHLEAGGPLPVERVARIAADLLDALSAAHAAGIVHRDIKPANVMLASNDEVLLTDFGIARQESDIPLTVVGGLVGSVEYMAPERLNGDESRPASDLFSLGATLYQAVTGTSPFRRATLTETLSAVLRYDVPAPPEAGELAPLITALLAKDSAGRPTLLEARSLIGGLLGSPRPMTRRQRVVLLAAASGTAVALVVAVVLIVTSGSGGHDLGSGRSTASASPTGTGYHGLPDPCDAADAGITKGYALQPGTSSGYDNSPGEWVRSCEWRSGITQDATSTLTLVYAGPGVKASGSPSPIAVHGAPSAAAVSTDSGLNCTVHWPTSFGMISVLAKAPSDTWPGTTSECQTAADFGSQLLLKSRVPK